MTLQGIYRTTIVLDKDTRRKLQEIAKKLKISQSAAIRLAIIRMWKEVVK